MENELKEIIKELESELNVWQDFYEGKIKEKPDYTDYDYYEILKAKLEGINTALRILKNKEDSEEVKGLRITLKNALEVSKEQEREIGELKEKCESWKKRFEKWTSKKMFSIMKKAVYESKVPEKILVENAENKAKYFTEFLMSNPEYLKEIGFKKDTLKKVENATIQRVINEIKKSKEDLADLEHYQWAYWTDYLIRNYNLENKERWRVQVLTPYEDLSEKEKKSDRVWANKVINKLISNINRLNKKNGRN